MILLGGFSMTATRSKRNTRPKGGGDGGTGKTLSSFIFRIIKGPWANWIILEMLYAIDWYAVERVQPCGCVCMTRLLPFTLLGKWAVFSRIIINALVQSFSSKAALMSCEMCSRYQKRCCWTVESPARSFSNICNSPDETWQSKRIMKARKLDNVKTKKYCFPQSLGAIKKCVEPQH